MDPTADAMHSVALHVSSYHEAVVRLDERRRIARVLRANDADGNFARAQQCLLDMRDRRAFAWLVGELLRVVDAEDAPDPLPFVTLADTWLGRETA